MRILNSRASMDVTASGDRPPSADPDTGPGMFSRENIATETTGAAPFTHNPRDTAPAAAEAAVPHAIDRTVAQDLARILPPPDWLTPSQRRLWLLTAAAYRAKGLSPLAAEQEAMAELAMTGQLSDPSPWRAWPDRTAGGPKPPDPNIEPARDIASYAKPERPDHEPAVDPDRFPTSETNPS